MHCKAKPFTRHYDLERHFKTVHPTDEEQGGKAHLHCDYKKCTYTEPFRKDHCREHYREYHSEDLIKRGQPGRNSGLKHRKQSPEAVGEFLAALVMNVSLNWWRCSRCVQRVPVNSHGYTCPRCNLSCEPERVAWREEARKPPANNAAAANLTLGFGSAHSNYFPGCG